MVKLMVQFCTTIMSRSEKFSHAFVNTSSLLNVTSVICL